MNEFLYDGQDLEVTKGMQAAFEKDGFFIVKGLFNKDEVDIVESALQGPESLSSDTYSFGRADGDGKSAKMSLWNNAGNDTTGVVSRMHKMAGTAEKLMGGEVYHYHTKLIMKDAQTGGRFVWHQDYGYWYNFACLFPDMITSFIAIDNCDRGNGCLQILKGSHRCGRIDHVEIAGQTGADLERVAEIEKVCDKLYVELDKGDAMFFHCNLLHTSAQNISDRRRWALLACYSSAQNSPYEKKVHAFYNPYQPLEILENDALLKAGVNREFEGKDVIKPADDGGYYTVVA